MSVGLPGSTFTLSCPSPGLTPLMSGFGGMASWKLKKVLLWITWALAGGTPPGR